MKLKPLKQPNSLACGPVCIYLATKYFGHKVDFKKIERLSDYKRKQGMTDKDIVKTFKKLGYRAKHLLNSSWDNLSRLNKKDSVLIVSWMRDGYVGHVSIVDKVTKDHIHLIDSEKGRIVKLKKVQFMRLWMEYDGLWWPRTTKDINLRSIIVVQR